MKPKYTTEALEYEDKSIEVYYFDNSDDLKGCLAENGLEYTDDTIAYCDTFGDEDTTKWGRLYLLNDRDLDSTIHECIHLTSGIMAQKGYKTLDLTTKHATPVEEAFCGLVGNLVGLLFTAQQQEIQQELNRYKAKYGELK